MCNVEIQSAHLSDLLSPHTVCGSAVGSSMRAGVQVSQDHGDTLLMSPEITGAAFRDPLKAG